MSGGSGNGDLQMRPSPHVFSDSYSLSQIPFHMGEGLGAQLRRYVLEVTQLVGGREDAFV